MPQAKGPRHHNTNPALEGFATYADALEVAAGNRLLFVSGQLGMADDGTVSESVAEQCALAWRNLGRALAAAGMGLGDLVMLRIYLTDAAQLGTMRRIKDETLGELRVASSVLVVAALADPGWQIEIEAVAAKPPG